MDSLTFVICTILGFLLCCSYGFIWYLGKSQAVPPVFVQYEHEQQELFAIFSKEGVNITPEQSKRITEDITDYQKKHIGF